MKYKKLMYNMLLDLGLISFLLILFMITRYVFSWYGKMLESFETELQFIGAGLQEGSLESLEVLENSLSSFNSQVQWIMILIFIVLPLLVYLGHWLTNYVKLNLMMKKRWKNKVAFNSLFWGLPFFFLFIILLNSFVTLVQNALYYPPQYFLIILSFIGLIVIHFGYTCTMITLQKNNFKRNIKKVLLNGAMTMYLYIPMLLTNVIILLMLLLIFVRVATDTFGWTNILHIGILIIASALLYLQKNKFVKNKNSIFS